MPSQLTIEAALDHQLQNVAESNIFWIKLARNEARLICQRQGSVTTDDIREWSDRAGFQPESPHAFGAVLKCKGFVWIGRERSRYKTNNGRFIGRWRWTD